MDLFLQNKSSYNMYKAFKTPNIQPAYEYLYTPCIYDLTLTTLSVAFIILKYSTTTNFPQYVIFEKSDE